MYILIDGDTIVKMCNANGNSGLQTDSRRKNQRFLHVTTAYTTLTCTSTCTHDAQTYNLYYYSIMYILYRSSFNTLYFIISDLGNTTVLAQQTEQENEHVKKNCQDENTNRE